MAVGRISGPLLKANLLRQGVDLAFETDLLYLDVSDPDPTKHKVGIKTTTPRHELDVNGTARFVDLDITNQINVDDIIIRDNIIESRTPILRLGANNTVIFNNKLIVDSFDIEGNLISTNESNADIDIRTSGIGSVNVYSDLNVTGSIHTTGDISADGSITLGDSTTDGLIFNAELASDIIPDVDNLYSLGSDPTDSTGKAWRNLYANNIVANAVETNAIIVNGIDLALTQGNIYYVAENGDDVIYNGDHPNSPFATVEKALSVATDGDTIHIYPGIYTENFPLTIPVGVTVKGHGIRSVNIVPTVATQNKDAFLLNGECTVEDLTVRDFFFNSSTNEGYAFKFAPGFTVTLRSPYIRNVTVITAGSVTNPPSDPRGFNSGDAGKGAYLDGSVATASSREASGLFHSVTFITPGVDALTVTNGVRVEWLNSFTYFADKGVYALDGSTGLKGSGQTALRVSDLTGSFTAGETVTYYDTDGITVLATGTIDTVDTDGKFYVNGKLTGFQEATERPGKTLTANGDAQLNTTTKKFGTASLALDGTGDYVTSPSSTDFGFGTGDFTVETFVRLTDLVGTQQVFDFRNGAGADIASTVYVSNGGQIRYYTDSADRITGSTLSSGTWYHVALCRESGSTKLFVDGTQVGSTYTDSNDYGTSKPLTIGSRYDGGNPLGGYFDEFRVIKGSAAYTGAFTPSVTELPVSQDTVLKASFNGTNASTDFADSVVYSQDIRFSGGASATQIDLVDFTDFGAEIRMIGSANVYGNYGLYGDGPGVIVYAIGQNLAYIGNGKEVTNDPTTVIQANEVVELNNARIRYNSVDHQGDFRVGDLFYVDQQTGTVSFTSTAFNINTQGAVTLTDGTNTTTISGTEITTGDIKISDSTIETISTTLNLRSATGEINLDTNLNVSGDIDVDGNVTFAGDIQIGDSSLDSINFIGAIDSDIIPNFTSTYNLGIPTNTWKTAYLDKAQIDDIEINDNYIQTTVTNQDLELRANGTGRVYIPDADLQVDNDVTVNGTLTAENAVIKGALAFTGDVTTSGDFEVGGNTTIFGNLNVTGDITFEEIKIDDNFITTTSSNADLELRTAGTGSIVLDDLVANNDITVSGNVFGSNITTSGDIIAATLDTGNIIIEGNVIKTTESNSDLELKTSGTGSIVMYDLSFNDWTISSTRDLNLNPGPNYDVVITSTSALKLPVGDTSQRPTDGSSLTAGQIRFNTDNSGFEGYNGSDWVALTGVQDGDGDTKITAELTPGADDDTIRFIVKNEVVASINNQRLETKKLLVDNEIEIDGNRISTVNTNTDLILEGQGTGGILIDNFLIKDNSITNTISDSITEFVATDDGYFKFAGTKGLIIPSGASVDRPPAGLSETGMIRYNTSDARVEVYNGTQWESVAGSSAGISRADAEDIALSIVISLG